MVGQLTDCIIIISLCITAVALLAGIAELALTNHPRSCRPQFRARSHAQWASDQSLDKHASGPSTHAVRTAPTSVNDTALYVNDSARCLAACEWQGRLQKADRLRLSCINFAP